MAKVRDVYRCGSCGYETAKWMGRCPSCGEWNTLQLSAPVPSSGGAALAGLARPAKVTPIGQADVYDDVRYYTGIGELDRVLGGGLVKGSVILLGGEPGIGKSTLLMQICQSLGQSLKVLYISGEESVRQIKLRANRLAVASPNLFLFSGSDLEVILSTIEEERPDVVMIDSIQTMVTQSAASSAGSVTQVRECAGMLLKAAKAKDIAMILVGHVTKEGNLAGPRVLEHMVDAVLQFEGEQNYSYRILRAMKNRFGATNEIAVFEMGDKGLSEVINPSAMLLSERPEGVSGSCVVCLLEGSRPVLAEVQALISKTSFPAPRRTAAGFDYNRMSMLIAVLEKRAGYFFGNLDAYLNVVGGLRLDEPASDLPVALAMVSGLRDKPIPHGTFAVGELGLGGEVRSVIRVEDRIREGQRLGFSRCIVPFHSLEKIDRKAFSIKIIGVKDIREALAVCYED